MSQRQVVIGALLEDACLTLEQLCSVAAVSEDWVSGHVLEGRLHPRGNQPSQWRFGGRDLWRVRQMRRVEIAFDAEPELAALVADLLEELDSLRAQLRRLGP
jgi:chaperone modulatory protein CbpM